MGFFNAIDQMISDVISNRNEPAPDVQGLLSRAGIMGVTQTAATPAFVGTTPKSSNTSASVTLLLVRGMQRLANEKGYGLVPDGIIGPKTVTAISHAIGGNWTNMKWVQVYQALVNAPPAAATSAQPIPVPGLDTPIVSGGMDTNMMLAVAAGLGAAYYFGLFGKRRKRK